MKKLFSVILALFLMAALCVTAFAEETSVPESTIPIKETQNADPVLRLSAEKRDGTIVEIDKFSNFNEGWNAATSLALNTTQLKAKDYARIVVDLCSDWEIDGTSICFPEGIVMTLNLNGYTIDRGLDGWDYDGEVIYIDEKANVIINNGTVTGGFSCNGAGGIHIENDARVILNNVNVTGNAVEDDKGSAIAIYDGATFIMNGGRISDNKVTAFVTAFDWAEGTVFVKDATAVFNGVTISGNQIYNKMSPGAAISMEDGANVTLNNCIVEKNATEKDSLATSLFYAYDPCYLSLNNTTVKNNGYEYDTETNFYHILFDFDGALAMNGCTVSENIGRAIFGLWLSDADITVNVIDSRFTDNSAQMVDYRDYKDTPGNNYFNFTDCSFHKNKGYYSDYTFYGRSFLKYAFIACSLGDSSFDSMENVTILGSDTELAASSFSEGNLAMVVALSSLVISVSAVVIAVVYGKKKSVSAKAENNE